jgi:hypothetical protein
LSPTETNDSRLLSMMPWRLQKVHNRNLPRPLVCRERFGPFELPPTGGRVCWKITVTVGAGSKQKGVSTRGHSREVEKRTRVDRALRETIAIAMACRSQISLELIYSTYVDKVFQTAFLFVSAAVVLWRWLHTTDRRASTEKLSIYPRPMRE